MAYTVDLESNTFSSTKLDLDITLRTSVEILIPVGATGLRYVENLKNALYSGIIWVDQLPELRLNIHVSAESDLSHPLTILTSQMGDALCNSQCWLELGLGVLFKSSPKNSGVTPRMERPYRVDEVVGHSKSSALGSILLANDTCHVSEFISLFNLGFSTLVRDNPPRICKYPILEKSKLQSLSRIAPSVFSPRYREAMNERAQLIPLIAKSMCSILKSTRNKSLQDKAAALEASQRCQLEDLSAIPDVMDPKTIIMTSLWCIAQKKLYKPEASRRISPLWPMSRPCSVSPFEINTVTKKTSKRISNFTTTGTSIKQKHQTAI
ncbi:hypothetical protein AARAC_001365 [Aspergillus arachidicola]|uniref:Uncharacterized protein n=1 Tax=Aspergillus arachidicola TaxID=656916 RepID=A0A2G7G670_9EURO|nr:hypothetical protein AARAC_001365 [Aspergillus arachidicola]